MSEQKSGPPLANLVLAGTGQTEAVVVTDFIFMAKDISNAYLVTTADGDVLVNSGTAGGAERTRGLFAPVRTGPLRRIILTQSHADHYGGVAALREPGTQVVTEIRYPETRAYYEELSPFFGPRTGKLWAKTLARQGPPIVPQEVVPDVLVDRELAFEVGGRRFELISTPDGETIDSLSVWMPDEKVVFTGNLFGPIFLAMPFLCTVRGDKQRSVLRYLRSLETVRDLGAELLVTGHGDPIRGAARIRADLDRMHAAVSYVNDQTKAGMNAGKDVHTLMREITLPPEIAIGEWHGKVSWAVRTIWEEYSGWFHYDSTTSLYGVPRSSVDRDLVELAGGTGRIAARADQHLAEGRPLEALHLLDIALGAEPDDRAALDVALRALQRLLEDSGGTNLSETMWLRSEIDIVTEKLAGG